MFFMLTDTDKSAHKSNSSLVIQKKSVNHILISLVMQNSSVVALGAGNTSWSWCCNSLIVSLTDWCPVEFDPNMDQQEPGCDAEQLKHVENKVADTTEGEIQQYL